MKSTHHLLLALLAAALLPGCSKKDTAGTATASPGQSAPAASAPSAGAPASGANMTDAQVVEMIGWFVGTQSGVAELGMSNTELDSFFKGMRTAAAGGKEPFDRESAGPKLDQWVQARQARQQGAEKEKNTAAGIAFFAKLDEDKTITKTASGLRYKIETPGSGPTPKPTDMVKVHYTGRFIDGKVFDSSVERGQPAEFSLDGVIPGWTEGMQKISKGGKMKLYVPANLAYGDNGRPPNMPPAAALIFDVELLEIAAEAPPAPNPMIAK